MARGASLGSGIIDLPFLEYDTAAGANAGTSELLHRFLKVLTHASGTSSGQIDRVYSVVTSSTTSPATLDLSGALASPIATGATVVFVDCQYLIFENTGTSGSIKIGGGSTPVGISDGTTDYACVIPPGGWVIYNFGTDGLAIGAGTTDLLRHVATAGTIAGKLYAVGRSA